MDTALHEYPTELLPTLLLDIYKTSKALPNIFVGSRLVDLQVQEENRRAGMAVPTCRNRHPLLEFELAFEGFALDLEAAQFAVDAVQLLGLAVDLETQP